MHKGEKLKCLMIIKPSDYKYIGSCSCGFEPDFFYTTPKGTIVHASQTFKRFQNPSMDFFKEQDVKEVK